MDFQNYIEKSRRIAFFGGAGVSTESGIPDFRSVDGLYNQKFRYPPETMLSHGFFVSNPSDFFEFYRDKMISYTANPNPAHIKLAELEKAGKITGIVTQNIDGLHAAAGSERVYELHGSVHRNYCVGCGKFFPMEYIKASAAQKNGIPRCDSCGGIVKPDVVLYGESLDAEVLDGAIKAISNADLLIIGGTSLTVYPASSLIDFFRGDNIILVNRDKTSADSRANLVIREPIGQTFDKLRID